MAEADAAALKTCGACGAENPLTAIYCGECGTPIAAPIALDPAVARARKAYHVYLAIAISSLLASMGGNIAIQSAASSGGGTKTIAKVVYIITGVCFLAYLGVLANLAEKAAFSIKNWVLAGLLSPFTLFSFLYTLVVTQRRLKLIAGKPVTYYRAPLGLKDSSWGGLSARQASSVDVVAGFESAKAYRYDQNKRMKLLAKAINLDRRNHLALYFLAYEYSLAGRTEDAASEISEAYHLMPVPLYREFQRSLQAAGNE
jgi:hypothetical protein